MNLSILNLGPQCQGRMRSLFQNFGFVHKPSKRGNVIFLAHHELDIEAQDIPTVGDFLDALFVCCDPLM